VTAGDKGGEQSPPDPDEVLDPAYPDIETQRTDIAERARIMDHTMAEIEKRAEVIAVAIRKIADTRPKSLIKKSEIVSAEELNVKSRPNATPFSRPIPTPLGVRNSVSGRGLST